MKTILIVILAIILSPVINAQTCTPTGNQTSYGTADTWIGYIYDNMDFTNYSGFVNEGTAGNSNFDESFGGDNVNYATNGCLFIQKHSVPGINSPKHLLQAITNLL